MKHSSLYQKYRPKNFSEIVGQNHVIKTLVNSIKLDNIGHAYIFSGPKGVGKTTIAKIFSKAINCLNFKDDICDECENCQIIASNDTTDILELDAASNNGVDDVRRILDNTKFLPVNLKYKVYIIDEAHMLTNSSWNAFLKTLEEPPMNVVFIFATTEFHKIPQTIVSRCQCFEFNRLTDKQIHDLIVYVNEKEKIKATKSAIEVLTNLSTGCARDALSMLEQAMLYTDNDITDIAINEMFGLTNDSEKIAFIKMLIEKDVNGLIKKTQEFQQKGINFSQLVLGISNILTDQLIYLQTNDPNILNNLSLSNIHDINLSKEQLIALITIFQKTYIDMRNNDDQQLFFQIMFFKAIEKLNTNSCLSQPNIVEQKQAVISSKSINQPKLMPNNILDQEKEIDLSFIRINSDEIFETKEILIENKNKEDKKVKQDDLIQENNNDQSTEEIILSILSNKTKEDTNNAQKLLDKFLFLSEVQPLFSRFSNGCKVSVASKNGIIFSFKDEIDADWLNSNYANKEIQTITKEIIGHVCFLIGSTYKKLKNIHSKISKIKKPEPNLDSLNKLFDSDIDTDTIGKKIFGI